MIKIDSFMVGLVVGVMCVLLSAFIVSCTVTPLDARIGELGSDKWNPVYVYIVNDE